MALSPTEESLVRQLIAQNPALLNLASSESTIISKLGATKVSLSDLSAATSLSDADLALVRQGLNDKSFAMSVLRDYVSANLPTASTTTKGIVELATNTETQTGTDAVRAVTPAGLASVTATETRAGLIKLATTAEAQALANDAHALTPKKLSDVINNRTWQDLTASRLTNTNYTNSSGIPINVQITFSGTSGSAFYLQLDGETIAQWTNNGSGAAAGFLLCDVPDGSTYRLFISSGTYTAGKWKELR